MWPKGHGSMPISSSPPVRKRAGRTAPVLMKHLSAASIIGLVLVCDCGHEDLVRPTYCLPSPPSMPTLFIATSPFFSLHLVEFPPNRLHLPVAHRDPIPVAQGIPSPPMHAGPSRAQQGSVPCAVPSRTQLGEALPLRRRHHSRRRDHPGRRDPQGSGRRNKSRTRKERRWRYFP